MNEAIVLGRLRPMVRQCRDGACPCMAGDCQLAAAITQVELECGTLSPTLEALRAEIYARLADLEAACETDTDPDFFSKLHENPVTSERRLEIRYQVPAAPARIQLETGHTVEAEIIDASYRGAGLLLPKDTRTTAKLGDQVRVMRSDLWQLGEIRGMDDVDGQTRLAIAWLEDQSPK